MGVDPSAWLGVSTGVDFCVVGFVHGCRSSCVVGFVQGCRSF